MRRHRAASLVVLFVLGISACGGSSTSPTTTTTTTTTTNPTNEIFTGTVPAAIGDALQSASNPFTVVQSGGTLSVTLTSAVETFPDNTLLPTVTMGLAIGLWANNTCTPLANAYTPAQASATAQLSGTANAGSYCVQVSDITKQLGPVAYAVAVSHY